MTQALVTFAVAAIVASLLLFVASQPAAPALLTIAFVFLVAALFSLIVGRKRQRTNSNQH